MATQITEDEDKLRRRARRRLIGAVALTLIVVIALPMILDSEPKPVGQNIELTIPNKDKVGEFVPKMDLLAVSAPTPTTPNPVQVAAPPAVVAAVPVLAPVATPGPIPVADSQPASAPTVATAPITVTTQAEQKNSPEVKPEAKPATKPTSKTHAVPKAGFVVQIGAFSKTETAENWRKKLSKRGFKVYTEQVNDKVRVRVGPYPTHEAAEKARRKLEAAGLRPNIVELHE